MKSSTDTATPAVHPRDAWDNWTPETGRADGCVNTNIGPGRSDKESDVDTSLPPPAVIAQETPHPARMSRLDGCPACVVNTEPPRSIQPTADGYIAAYLCTDCGHAWLTSWKDD